MDELAMPRETGTHGLPIIYTPEGYRAPGASRALVREPKAAERTAAEIVGGIMSGQAKVGERLAPEIEMLAQHAVSRESLREALRLLENQGVLDIKRGPGGGPFVAPINPTYLARTASMYFHLSGARYEELFDTWALLEPALVAKVAERTDRVTKSAIFAPYVEYDTGTHDLEGVFQDLINFHTVIADLSGNRVLTLLSQAVSHLVVHQVLNASDPISENTRLVHSHSDIAAAIIAGRATKARNLMAEHIHEVTEQFRAQYPQRLTDQIEWRI